MTSWILWGLLLLLQNASFTAVSRARNSGSFRYHALAAVFSNGIWFGSMFFVVDLFNQIRKRHDPWLLLAAFTFYIVMTVTGSVAAHYFLMRHVEKGRARVGSVDH